ncbi:MAG: hypothetical protein KIT09_34525 [Bryobacteraceae bacterium]|nr:hypothetical protein [Bryobacteraceae bacterium]
MTTSAAVLPIGLWRSGARSREALLRPMSGADQEFLIEAGSGMPPAVRATALLARCVERIGHEPVTPAVAAELAAGDREALLLHVRRLTFGDKLDPVVRCPNPDCGKNMDVPLRVRDLLVQPAAGDLPEYLERDLPDVGTIRFRLPSGADQAAVADLARRDAPAAARAMLARCAGWDERELPDTALNVVSAWMADLDPQAEIRLNLACPECGQAFTSLLDAGAFLFEESAMRSRGLYREVHLLAFYYHWGESEILGLTPSKRKRYLDMLMEALE